MQRSASVESGGRPSGLIQSADRALRVLEAVGEVEEGVTARQVAERLNIALATTYHLLSTLVHAGYVVHLADERRYVLGYKVYDLEAGLRRQLRVTPATRRVLRDIHRAADAPVYLALFRDREVAIADVADSPERPRVAQLDVGLHEVPHVTAFGKIMLAAMEADVRHALIEELGLPAVTRRSATSVAELDRELDGVRRHRLAVEIDEFMPRLACMAVPVCDPIGRVRGAVSVSVPSADLGPRRRAMEAAVRLGAGQLSATFR
ncbi:IclR family transcriptional regulator [Phytoactinopolyspora halotolerans]|uniref:Glycerol operon regulatory protein n=1 Tax=Phytoactinopolyspora halotolerans TaxID=1981512 RepID=A0A6L9SD61_9ACTN|nr:IclR family transcriptional regulator [Phytoactinopolyspora halotolerans]NEE03315.1 IclR family transcriptional regulator [Phytoactinopolyspora halotolerans]